MFSLIKKVLVVFVVVCSLSSCATIMSGGSPSVVIDGDFTKPVTIVTQKGQYSNVTLPFTVEVNQHSISGQRIEVISQSGKSANVFLRKRTNGWAWGNLLLGGIPGITVDLITNKVSKPDKYYFVNEL